MVIIVVVSFLKKGLKRGIKGVCSVELMKGGKVVQSWYYGLEEG